MQHFIQKHGAVVTGCLSGFDRLVLRGTLRQLCHVQGMMTYLSMAKVLLKDFGRHAETMSRLLKEASLAVVLAAGRPVQYLESSRVLGKLTEPLCQHTRFKGQRVRGLNPFRKDDLDLLAAISAAEFCIHGVRNTDLRQRLYGLSQNKDIDRRHSARVTRKLRLLRAHGLIRKVQKSHRYLVTTKGRTALTALLAARDASTEKLTQMVA